MKFLYQKMRFRSHISLPVPRWFVEKQLKLSIQKSLHLNSHLCLSAWLNHDAFRYRYSCGYSFLYELGFSSSVNRKI
jgi:hypothetical protein